MFLNTTRYAVLTRGNPDTVDMVLQMVANPEPMPVPVLVPPPVEPQELPDMVETPAPIENVEIVQPEVHPGVLVACTDIYGYHESSIKLGDDLKAGETYTIS